MNRPITTPIELPVGPSPGWELGNDEEDEEKRSIAESCVLVHALRQSRERWLFSTFPRFSTKSRGAKAADQVPPPHTIQTRGKCDLEIGPHIFPDTIFYEVHYLPSQANLGAGYSYQPSTASWQSKTPYGASVQPGPTTAVVSNPHELDKSSTPLISSLSEVTTITPALINQVNSAAASNPVLANLLQLAAAGMATPEQLKTLGLLIQSLATSERLQRVPPSFAAPSSLAPTPAGPSATPSSAPPPFPIKEFDLVLEFRDTPSERWIFPRGLVTCERITESHTSDATSDVVIKACLPFEKAGAPGDPGTNQTSLVSSANEVPQVAVFHLRRTQLSLWDTISRWVGDERKMEQNRLKLSALKPIEHVYLGYQLSQGPLLSQLQAASAPTYTMKALKASATTVPRRRRRAATKQKVDLSTPQANDAIEQPAVPKRRRVSQPDRGPATQIQCVSCKNKDVPLILGGRFCRPCADAGCGIPVSQPHRYSTSVPTQVPAVSQPVPRPTTPALDNPP
ncbi:hypothetical protein LshimejAT787_0302120 [Lyophyllum shimeji]|uniref:Uncharacterized protein n=1 Tax=Lyophyllum shimeji TaxID=47721 RepID=A0A9P3PI91_LYOSH|nr:hypothetical protein LshimejAT787_0302120 [Lyophyllum shimeji]